MAGITEVGARVTLTGAAKAIRTTLKLAEANDKLAASYDRVAEASKASAGSTDAAAVSSKEAAAAAATSGSGVVAGSKQRTKALTEEEKALKKTEQAHSDFSTKVKSIAASSVGTFGKWGALGFLGLSYEGIKQYQTYQYKITQLMTQAGVQQKNLAGLYSGGLTISKTTGLHLSTVGNQLYRIASARAGLHATNAELLSLSRQAANVAVLFNTAPGGPTEQVARIFGALATARTSGLRTVGSNKHMAALINATVGGSDIRGSTLIGGLGRGVLQSGSAVGASLPTILAWIGASTKFGAQASSSGTLIAHSLQQLATPSAQGQAAEAMFGIKQGELKSLISHQGIRAAISDFLGKIEGGGLHVTATMPSTLSQRTKGMTNRQDALTKLLSWGLNRTLLAKLTAGGPLSKNTQSALLQFIMTKAFGGARQEIPLLTLTQSHVFTSTLTYIKKHATTKNFQKDLIKAYSTPQQQQRIAEANLQVGLAQFGKAIDPMWIKFLHGLVDFVDYFAKNSGALKALLIGFGSLAGVGLSAVALKHVLSWIDAFQKLFKGVKGLSLLSGTSSFGSSIFGKGSTTLGGTAGLTGALQENAAATTRLTEVMTGEGGLGGGVLGGTTGGGGAVAEGTVIGRFLSKATGGGLLAGGGVLKGFLPAGIEFSTLLSAIVVGALITPSNAHKKTSAVIATALTPGPRRVNKKTGKPTPNGIVTPRTTATALTSEARAIALQQRHEHTGAWIAAHMRTNAAYATNQWTKSVMRGIAKHGLTPGFVKKNPYAAAAYEAYLHHQQWEPSHKISLRGTPGAHKNTFAGAYWLAVNRGEFGPLQSLLSSGKSFTTGVAQSLLGGATSLTTAQIAQRVRWKRATWVRRNYQTPQAVKFDTAEAKNQAWMKAVWNNQVRANGLSATHANMQAWLAAGMTHTQNVPWKVGAKNPTEQIRSTQEKLAESLRHIFSTPKLTANQKVQAEAAVISNAAATLQKDAAKKSGDAAAVLKEASATLKDAANAVRNLHVNVNITGKQLAGAVNTATAQAVARA